MPLRMSDTHPEVEKIQIAGLQSAPLGCKLQMVSDLAVATRMFALSGLRRRFPNARPEELHRRLATLILGPELAARVYGREPDPPTML
jgi:hypothetical protein